MACQFFKCIQHLNAVSNLSGVLFLQLANKQYDTPTVINRVFRRAGLELHPHFLPLFCTMHLLNRSSISNQVHV